MNITDVDFMNNHTGFANNFNSTLSSSDDLTFQDVIEHPFFYGSSIIFIFLLLFVISIVIILKNKSKLLLTKPA